LYYRSSRGICTMRDEDVEFLHAAFDGRASDVAKLIARNEVNVNIKNPKGYAAIHAATMRNHPPVVDLLLNCVRVEVNSASDEGNTPLLVAASGDYDSIVTLFLACERVDINSANENGITPMHAAAVECNASIVASLAEAGAVLRAPFESNTLSLHKIVSVSRASPKKKAALLALLKKHGCVVNDGLRLSVIGFLSRYYFQDGQGKFYERNVKYQR
jgi:ankyrin repeat protein